MPAITERPRPIPRDVLAQRLRELAHDIRYPLPGVDAGALTALVIDQLADRVERGEVR